MKEEGRPVVGGGDLDGEGGKSVQLLLTGRLSVKQWDLWGRGGGGGWGGLGIRGRCHRLLWITFMKAPSSLSHPPKNLLPQ